MLNRRKSDQKFDINMYFLSFIYSTAIKCTLDPE